MDSESVLAVILAALGSNVVTAWSTAWLTRRRTAAEAGRVYVETADMLVNSVRGQLEKALERIAVLEAREVTLKEKVDAQQSRIEELEHHLIRNGWQVPPTA